MSDPFTNIEILDIPDPLGNLGQPTLSNTQQVSGGISTSSYHIDDQQGLWLGANKFVDATFRVNLAGQLYATGANISGTITATVGSIGGWTISGAAIYFDGATDALSSGMAPADYPFYAGKKYADRATASFRVTPAGLVTASNITITGGSVAVSTLSGTLTLGVLDIAARGWSQTCAFSVTDADTIAWGSGVFTSADGTAYSISAGNTGNMTLKTYIYLDTAVGGGTAYQITTTAATAVGAGKVLVAIAQNGTGEATYLVLQGQGGANWDGAAIVAGSVTANELSTSLLYAGAITIDTAGLIKSGQTAYDTGTGWWIGNVTGTPKLSIGNSAGNKMTWDGTALTITGALLADTSIVKSYTAGEYIDANKAVFIENSGVVDITRVAFTAGGADINIRVGYNTANFEKWAQSFQYTYALGVDKLVIYLQKAGSPTDNLRIGIQGDNTGVPSGTYIQYTDTAASGISASSTEYTIVFPATVVCAANTKYWLVFERTGTVSDTNYIKVSNSGNSGTFAEGALWVYGGGAWGAQSGGAADLNATSLVETSIAGQLYQTKANTAGHYEAFIGFTKTSVVRGGAVNVILTGVMGGFSGLTTGGLYYISNTLGEISDSAGTNTRKCGIATSTTELLITNIW